MTMTDRSRRVLGVKVEAPEDLGRAVSALGNVGEKGSVDYTLARRELVAAARSLGDDGLKSLPSEWGVTADDDGVEYKALPTAAITIDETEGIVEAFVAISGTKDRVDDIIYSEALEFALKERTPKAVWHHDITKPIGRTLEAAVMKAGDARLPTETKTGAPWPTEAGALWVKSLFNRDTQRGHDAWSDVVFFKDEIDWSIGYRVPRGGAKMDKQGVRHIKQLIIPEYSPVMFGAHPLTATMGTKDENGGTEETKAEPDESKSGTIRLYLSGSDEERIDQITDAIEAWLAGGDSGIDMNRCMARVVGTFADRVVFCVMTFGDYDGEPGEQTPDLDADDNYFQAGYTIEGAVAVLGEVTQVDISTTISAKDEHGNDLEVKVGKMLSRANLAKIKAAHGALGEMLAVAEPPATKADANPMATKPHAFVAGPDGKCKVCGAAEASPMRQAAKDESGAIVIEVKGDNFTLDGATLTAALERAEATGQRVELRAAVKCDPEPDPVEPDPDPADGVKSELPGDLAVAMLEAERLRAGV